MAHEIATGCRPRNDKLGSGLYPKTVEICRESQGARLYQVAAAIRTAWKRSFDRSILLLALLSAWTDTGKDFTAMPNVLY